MDGKEGRKEGQGRMGSVGSLYTDCLIGILVMVSYHPHKTG